MYECVSTWGFRTVQTKSSHWTASTFIYDTILSTINNNTPTRSSYRKINAEWILDVIGYMRWCYIRRLVKNKSTFLRSRHECPHKRQPARPDTRGSKGRSCVIGPDSHPALTPRRLCVDGYVNVGVSRCAVECASRSECWCTISAGVPHRADNCLWILSRRA